MKEKVNNSMSWDIEKKDDTKGIKLPDVDEGMVIHTYMEALEEEANGVLANVDGFAETYEEMREAGKTNMDVAAHYYNKGDEDTAVQIMMLSAFHHVHEVIHQIIGTGKGVDGIEDRAVRELIKDWFNSDGFKEKHEGSLSLPHAEEMFKAALGIK